MNLVFHISEDGSERGNFHMLVFTDRKNNISISKEIDKKDMNI